MTNIHYIRAAIEEKTGINVSLPKLKQLLIEEGLVDDIEIYPNYASLDPHSPNFEPSEDDPYDLIPDESVVNLILIENPPKKEE